MRLSKDILLAALCCVAVPAAVQAQRPTHLVVAAYNDAAESKIAFAVLREAYRRLGITLEIQQFAGDVGNDRINSGAVDGMLARSDGIEARFPNVVQVGVPVVYVDVAVYSRDSTLRVRDWRDLSNVTVATVRGMFYLERSVGDLHVRFVDTYGELYPLLLNRQVDAVVTSDLQMRMTLRPMPQGIVRNNILASYMLYHYLHNKHAELVPEVERVLKDMLTDGTVARLREATVADIASGRVARLR